MSVPKEFTTPEGLRTLANFLRSQNGPKVKSGIEHDKRVDYFKGKKLIECILDETNKKWPKSLPRLTTKEDAIAVAEQLITADFFHRSEKVQEKKGHLRFSNVNVFDEKGYYTWMYAGNMMWSNIATGVIIAIVIGFTLLPVWPDAAKKILWYCSVTFLIATLSFVVIRLVLFLLFWICGVDFWIFPRLFDESLSFQDSFKPIYSYERSSQGQGLYRIGTVVVVIGFVYWALTQPTDFDAFLKAQSEFVDDLYSGKLLADVAFDPKDHMSKHGKKVPSLEDLLKDLERDEIADHAANLQEHNEHNQQQEHEEDVEVLRENKEFIQVEVDVDGDNNNNDNDNNEEVDLDD